MMLRFLNNFFLQPRPEIVKVIKGSRNPLDKEKKPKTGFLYSHINPHEIYSSGTFANIHKARLYREANGVIEKKTKNFVVKVITLAAEDGERINQLNAIHKEYLFSKEAGLGAKPPTIEKDKAYMCMNYIEGQDLLDYFIKRLKIDESECIEIILNLLLALKNQVSDKNMIHRDLKPDNIRINVETWKCVILDFGLAKWANDAEQMPCGSIEFGAPEVFNNRPHTPKMDIFSLGIIIALLCGHPPKEGRFRPNNLQLHPNLQWVEPLLRNMLALSPEDRSDIDSLIAQFETLLIQRKESTVTWCNL